MRFLRFTSDKLFLVAAVLLAAGGVIYAVATAPTRVKVAVGPPGSAEERLMTAFSSELKGQGTGIRLKVVSVPGVKEAAELLEAGKTDLAVVRTDVSPPENGLTLAILREAAAILLAPADGEVKDVNGLAGRKLGIVAQHPADGAYVESLLRHFDLEPPAVNFVTLSREEAVGALKTGKVDAVAFVASPASPDTASLVREVARAFEGAITVLPVDNAEGIAQRSPALSLSTIPEGAWGGRPKQPAREIKTVAVSYRLMAQSDTDRSTVSTLVESLFQMRSRLAVKARLANLMKAPEMDSASSATSAALPNHPGAVDYFQRETQSVMDRYGDWIYLMAFFGSGLISAFAWFVQRFRRHRREVIDDVLDRLLEILAESRRAETVDTLDRLTGEVDDLFRLAVEHARSGAAGNRTTSAIVLALDGARSAIDERRRKIAAPAGGVDPVRRDGAGPRLVSAS